MDSSRLEDILGELKEFVLKLKEVEIKSIILSLRRWLSTKGKINKVSFKRGDIVEIDLGLGYGFEMSYLHPCIILEDSNAGFSLVIPCSTGKFGKKNKYIINGTKEDGFKKDTGVLIDSIRCISKTRINRKVGEVSLEFYDRINEKILLEFFKKQSMEVRNLKKDYEAVLKENIELKKKLDLNN
ncbi:MAG: type II toxin-antitoxin system PemK/MazF family toxin [Clostridium sp.]|uniref:type II toxin-antitoxin system PemK/MazF family toxin n=1 Tax=Clostridium sp. TaxID=1506 RepID=UPI003F303197